MLDLYSKALLGLGVVVWVGVTLALIDTAYWGAAGMAGAGGYLAGQIRGIQKVRAEGAQAILEDLDV